RAAPAVCDGGRRRVPRNAVGARHLRDERRHQRRRRGQDDPRGTVAPALRLPRVDAERTAAPLNGAAVLRGSESQVLGRGRSEVGGRRSDGSRSTVVDRVLVFRSPSSTNRRPTFYLPPEAAVPAIFRTACRL